MKCINRTLNRPAHHLNADIRPNFREEDAEIRLGSWVFLYVLLIPPEDAEFKTLIDELKVARELILHWQFEIYSYPDCDHVGNGMIITTRVPVGLTHEAQQLYVHTVVYEELSEMLEEEGWEVYARRMGEDGNVAMGEEDEDADTDLGTDEDGDRDEDRDVDMLV